MARATLSLLLVVALYLGFTLLSSTDENLLLNAEVTVLQVGSGIALKQSYTFGPLVFLYLHLQALFVLRILHRKVSRFDTDLSHGHNSQLTPLEYWEWLSAFAFVQRFRPDHSYHLLPRFLMWISTEAIPVILLFVVTLSFVRYQSGLITWMHKVTFILALSSVIAFKCQVLEQSLLRTFFGCFRDFSGWFIKPIQLCKIAWKAVSECWKLRKRIWRELFCRFLKMVVAVLMALVLLIYAKPPTFDFASYEGKFGSDKEKEFLWEVVREERHRIWCAHPGYYNREACPESKQHTNADGWPSTSVEKELWSSLVWVRKNNILDVLPCEYFGFVCRRYLDVENLWLVTPQPNYVSVSKGNISNATDPDETQWFHINQLSLSGRNFRFANFRHAQLQGANLEFAHLEGASLRRTDLREALLGGAHLRGTSLNAAKLRGTKFDRADIQGANLNRTTSQGAIFAEANLQGASFKNAKLQGTNFVRAILRDADMESARLDNAKLWNADLENAILENARLWGASLSSANLKRANLRNAKLQGANFSNVELKDTCLEGAQLNGADLSVTKEIQYSFSYSIGTPESWELAWISKDLDEAAEQDWELFKKRMEGNPPDELHTSLKYWDDLAIWTAQFACRNKYTAYSSWNRWYDDEPLSHMKERADEEVIDRVKGRIFQYILDGRKYEECVGLLDISDEKWKRWRRRSADIRLTASRMDGVPDAHPVRRERRHSDQPLQLQCPTHLFPIQENIP